MEKPDKRLPNTPKEKSTSKIKISLYLLEIRKLKISKERLKTERISSKKEKILNKSEIQINIREAIKKMSIIEKPLLVIFILNFKYWLSLILTLVILFSFPIIKIIEFEFRFPRQ